MFDPSQPLDIWRENIRLWYINVYPKLSKKPSIPKTEREKLEIKRLEIKRKNQIKWQKWYKLQKSLPESLRYKRKPKEWSTVSSVLLPKKINIKSCSPMGGGSQISTVMLGSQNRRLTQNTN